MPAMACRRPPIFFSPSNHFPSYKDSVPCAVLCCPVCAVSPTLPLPPWSDPAPAAEGHSCSRIFVTLPVSDTLIFFRRLMITLPVSDTLNFFFFFFFINVLLLTKETIVASKTFITFVMCWSHLLRLLHMLHLLHMLRFLNLLHLLRLCYIR